MDADQAKTAKIKEARREILRVLNIMYHIGPFGFECVCEGLVHLELPDDECVQRDLTYLCERGYVRWTNEQQAYLPWNQRMYKLTARGNEFVERMTTDPALDP